LLARDMTIAAARRTLADRFRNAGIESPELDARILVGHALGLDHTALVSRGDEPLDDKAAGIIEGLAVRRLAREPIAHIIGTREFWGLALRVTPDTLVPRPETETIVEAALAALDAQGPRTRPLRIADLGTGSGAILLALLSEWPQAFGVGTDLSPAALAVARDNAARLGLAPRARFVAGDFGTALAGGFDLVVSNPPYIASHEIASLAPEVKRDPRLALDGGPDGLAAYRAIAADARRLLVPKGRLIVELGIGQEQAVARIFGAAGLAPGAAHADLEGVPRAFSAGPATFGHEN
jgi:release factor glutamine methyltransferase